MTDPPWLAPATGARLTHPQALARLAGGRAALLGERHDRAADHRWQAAVIAGLAALRAEVAVGFEMLPRRAQPALDAWGAGGLDEAGLVERTRWREVWGFEPELYLPLFRLCRELRLPSSASTSTGRSSASSAAKAGTRCRRRSAPG